MHQFTILSFLSACQLALCSTIESNHTKSVLTISTRAAVVTHSSVATVQKVVSTSPIPAPADASLAVAPKNLGQTKIIDPAQPTIAIGPNAVNIAPGVGGAGVVVDHTATIAPGTFATVSGLPVSLFPDGGSLVVGGTRTVFNPVAGGAGFTGVPGIPGAGPAGAPAGIAGGFAGGIPPIGVPFGVVPAIATNVAGAMPNFMVAGQAMQQLNAIQIGDQVMVPGQTLILANTTISLPTAMPANASVIIVNNVTSTLPYQNRAVAQATDGLLSSLDPSASLTSLPLQITAPPLLVINGRSFTPTVDGSSTLYPISPGQTVQPGDAFTLGGTRVSLDAANTALQVGSSMYTLAPTMAWAQVKSDAGMTSGAATPASLSLRMICGAAVAAIVGGVAML